MKSLCIISRTSGQAAAVRAKRRLLRLVSKTPNMDAKITSGPDDACNISRAAVEQGYECIVAAGGDGTINQILNGIGDADVALGIVPLGTGNVLAHHLNMPSLNVDFALNVILNGKIKNVDVALADSRRFLLMAGFGLDAAVVDSVSPRLKDIFGKMAYAPAAIEQLLKYSPSKVSLIFDDGFVYETDALGVVVANCGSYAYNFKIVPDAVFDDGYVDVLVFENTRGSKIKLAGKAMGAFFQQRLHNPDATYFKTSAVRIESEPPIKLQIDGDVAGESGVYIKVLPRALKLIVP